MEPDGKDEEEEAVMIIYLLLVDIFLLVLVLALIIEVFILMRWKRRVEQRLGQPMPGLDPGVNRSAFGGSSWGGGGR